MASLSEKANGSEGIDYTKVIYTVGVAFGIAVGIATLNPGWAIAAAIAFISVIGTAYECTDRIVDAIKMAKKG